METSGMKRMPEVLRNDRMYHSHVNGDVSLHRPKNMSGSEHAQFTPKSQLGVSSLPSSEESLNSETSHKLHQSIDQLQKPRKNHQLPHRHYVNQQSQQQSFSQKTGIEIAKAMNKMQQQQPTFKSGMLPIHPSAVVVQENNGSEIESLLMSGAQSELIGATEPHTPVVVSTQKLVPLEINFLLKENRLSHRTDDYDYPYLILRRGQPFTISIRFDRPFDPNLYKLTLQFTIGNQSLISKGTHIRIPIDGVPSIISGWKADFVKCGEECSQNTVRIEILTSPVALIGRYKVYLETQYSDEKSCLFRYAEDVPLIANPFCSEDVCYMSDEAELAEYLMNEDGVVYLGTQDNVVRRSWYFGQFQFPCLDIVLWLLERANLPYESRGNIYHIMRALAAMINGGDRGMLETFKYSAPSTEGTRQGFDPNEWVGSVKIVKKFMEQRGQPVRFGCTWIYSAVFCTMCRALGVPCRVITVYNTCHDCDQCSTIDFHWDRNHRPVTLLNKDTMKVLHTWNEMWFRRDDIPSDLNGWQVVDCSSISASESLYRLGPCPVKSICDGACAYLSDGQSFVAMLNSSVAHWLVERNGDMNLIVLDESNGKTPRIVTKGLLSSAEAVDLSDNYGCRSERHSPSVQLARRNRLIECSNKMIDDVFASVDVLRDSTHGDTVILTWILRNNSEAKRTCEFYMNSYFATSEGKLLAECKELRGDSLVLSPNETKQHHLKIRAEDYMDRVRSYHVLRIFTQMYVSETKQTKPVIYNFTFDSYDMIKLVLSNPLIIVDKQFILKIHINNPLKRVLQNCTLHIEGVGSPRTIILERSLRPLEVTVYQANLIPTRPGPAQIYVGFSCALLNNIEKTLKINVVEESGSGDDEDVLEKNGGIVCTE